MTENEWKTRVDAQLGKIDNRVSHMETTIAVSDVHRQNVEERLSNIESGQTWLIRLIIGSIILAAIGFALSGGLQQ